MKKQLVTTSIAITLSVLMLPALAGPGYGKSRFMQFFDTNQDGLVTLEEFETAAAKRFARMDDNHNNSVTADEFRSYMQQRRQEFSEQRFQQMDRDSNTNISKQEYLDYQTAKAETRFQRLDQNSDGLLSKSELAESTYSRRHRHGMKRPGKYLFGKLDLNGDGEITREESLSAWTHWFKRIDSNNDQVVAAEEVLEYRKNKRKSK